MKMLKPRVTTMRPSRFRPAPKTVDPFYLSAPYRTWRDEVVERAGRRCEHVDDVGRRCGRGEPHERVFADHIHEIADGGDRLDPRNGQCLCSLHHQRKTAAMRELRNTHRRGDAASHPDGLAPSRIPLTIVCGPPASGKSRYVAEHASPNDLIIDLDVIAAKLSGSTPHTWNIAVLPAAMARRNDLLRSLADPANQHPRAWFIVGEPEARWRDWWQRVLRPIAIIVIATDADTCLERISRNSERHPSRSSASTAVHAWWNSYTPRAVDIVVSPQGGSKNLGNPSANPVSDLFVEHARAVDEIHRKSKEIKRE